MKSEPLIQPVDPPKIPRIMKSAAEISKLTSELHVAIIQCDPEEILVAIEAVRGGIDKLEDLILWETCHRESR
jgi:hypothetical protein